MNFPPELRYKYQEGRLIPFIGAGASMSVTWDSGKKRGPSWREMVDQAARKLGFQSPDLLRARGTDLQILEYFRIRQHDFAALSNWMYAEMQPPDDTLRDSPIHKALAGLKECRLFYTTNYDDFIERALGLHGRMAHKVAIEAHMGKRSVDHTDECEVVKFHGDFSHPGEMVLSESHYERRLKLDSPMDYRLRADLLGRVVLFVGYSFRDWNVAYLFRLVNEQFSSNQNGGKRRAYITVPNPSNFELELFDARNIGVIPIDESKQTEEVASLLNEIARS